MRKKEIADMMFQQYGFDIEIEEKIGEVHHVFSHLIWELKVWKAKCKKKEPIKNVVKFVSKNELENFPFPVSHIKIKQFIDFH